MYSKAHTADPVSQGDLIPTTRPSVQLGQEKDGWRWQPNVTTWTFGFLHSTNTPVPNSSKHQCLVVSRNFQQCPLPKWRSTPGTPHLLDYTNITIWNPPSFPFSGNPGRKIPPRLTPKCSAQSRQDVRNLAARVDHRLAEYSNWLMNYIARIIALLPDTDLFRIFNPNQSIDKYVKIFVWKISGGVLFSWLQFRGFNLGSGITCQVVPTAH